MRPATHHRYIVSRVKTPDFAGDFDGDVRRVELGDRSDPGPPREQAFPTIPRDQTHWADDPHAGDGAANRIGLLRLMTHILPHIAIVE